MTPANAMRYSADEADRDMAGRSARLSGDAMDLAWALRGSQSAPASLRGEAGETTSREAVRPQTFARTERPAASSPALLSSDPDRGGEAPRDFTVALDLVHDACEAMRLSDERMRLLELAARNAQEEALDEVRALRAELAASERRAREAEARAAAAEARTFEAERWLAKLHDAILDGFGRQRGTGER